MPTLHGALHQRAGALTVVVRWPYDASSRPVTTRAVPALGTRAEQACVGMHGDVGVEIRRHLIVLCPDRAMRAGAGAEAAGVGMQRGVCCIIPWNRVVLGSRRAVRTGAWAAAVIGLRINRNVGECRAVWGRRRRIGWRQGRDLAAWEF